MTRHPLDRFNAWFSSAAGVWHTLIVTAAIVIGELAFPHLDPHGFWPTRGGAARSKPTGYSPRWKKR